MGKSRQSTGGWRRTTFRKGFEGRFVSEFWCGTGIDVARRTEELPGGAGNENPGAIWERAGRLSYRLGLSRDGATNHLSRSSAGYAAIGKPAAQSRIRKGLAAND